ncbi:MAG: hypothetical protein WC381_11405 [Kiritimatiellia bacterium]|jgi:hypothetical protein
MAFFRKRPVVIEALQFTRYTLELAHFLRRANYHIDYADGGDRADGVLVITTLEGDMRANIGDWIVRGLKGEFYPVRDDIFRQTYEEVLDADTP